MDTGIGARIAGRESGHREGSVPSAARGDHRTEASLTVLRLAALPLINLSSTLHLFEPAKLYQLSL